jgi:REP element-mobilizing transposase RayT
MGWLFEAKQRYGLRVLNHTTTSNHIHLLVVDGKEVDTIRCSLRLIAGRTGQHYNQRKQRRGAFWEDRYHATAVGSGEHLIQCLVYIDLNMVRTGVVGHPKQWLAADTVKSKSLVSDWRFLGIMQLVAAKNSIQRTRPRPLAGARVLRRTTEFSF